MLSDELLKIGQKVNKKSNIDISEKHLAMAILCRLYMKNGDYDYKRVGYVVGLVVSQLKKIGLPFEKDKVMKILDDCLN